jgi:DNA repair protein RecN (Recombination protein N)
MLTHLSVRNILLIEKLSLEFGEGLTVLTGETGAGKSILLDALGLALGSRADFGLIRTGSDRAVVSARFEIDPKHDAAILLEEAGIACEGEIILSRQLRGGGKSVASINDQPVSLALLRQCGDLLIEIQGQFEGRGLLDPASHIGLLDRAAGLTGELCQLAEHWQGWQRAKAEHQAAREALAAARAEEEWLRAALAELDQLAAAENEEEKLLGERDLHIHARRIAEALGLTDSALNSEEGAISQTGRALQQLERVAGLAAGRLDELLAGLGRASAELDEAGRALQQAAASLEGNPGRLEEIEDRLHQLRQLARKHQCEPDRLAARHMELAEQLARLDDSAGDLAALADQEKQAELAWNKLADEISASRTQAAARLDRSVQEELAPLKLEAARFATEIRPLAADRWSANGKEEVRFVASTNPGLLPGPIDRIASGGELARFLLALKVVLSSSTPAKTLIFDEVDSGVGGAVAAAVGARLRQLGGRTQTLTITHSPQVAACGRQHLKISKSARDDMVLSAVAELDRAARTEEVARMLAGAEITEEARAAARTLLAS